MRQVGLPLMLCLTLTTAAGCQIYGGRAQTSHALTGALARSEAGEARESGQRAAAAPVKLPIGGESPISISFAGDRRGVITGAYEQFWLTSDGGISWSEHRIRTAEEARGGEYNLVKSVMTPSGVIIALGHLEEVGSAIFSSFDGGKTWDLSRCQQCSLNGLEIVEDRAWAVGWRDSGAVVLRARSGEKWQETWRGSESQTMTDVDFVDADTGWAVGAGGLILSTRDGGRTWRPQRVSDELDLQSISFFDAKSGYAVGMNGVILHTSDGGETWGRQESPTRASLTNVIATGPEEAWATGAKGVILTTKDAGRRWRRHSVTFEADIYAAAIKDNEVWVTTSAGDALRFSKNP